jgi:two-component system sensor histidine kinase/response regulator
VGLAGDEYRLLQCLNNLIDNAVKFTEQGEIALTVDPVKETRDEITLRFLVRDTGIGIEGQHLEHLFEPFMQADNSATRRYGGTGLGLAISKKLVNLMKGEIWCQSTPGRGSSFGFTARFGRHHHAERLINQRRDFQGLSALVVDDSQIFRTVADKYLKAFGFEVSAAASGEEALDLVNRLRGESRCPDLVIVDLKMPGWDGLKTASQLNEAVPPGEPRPKIILTTTHSRAQVSKAAAKAGIKAVLEKPITADTLENVLEILFNAGAAGAPGKTPLSEAEQKRKLTRAAKGLDASSPAEHLAGAKILLVEDNEVNQLVAKKILLKAGLEVSVANNGREALEMVKAGRPFDLVLMDIQMPVMDGLTAAREIRRLDNGADLPIVALTAHSQPEDREKSFSAGMNDHLTKPLDIHGLFHCLDKFIKTGPAGQPA